MTLNFVDHGGRIKVMSIIVLHSTWNILKTVRDRGFVPEDHQWEMAYGVSKLMVT